MRVVVCLVALLLVSGCVRTQSLSLSSPEGRDAVNTLAARKPAVLVLAGEPGRRVRALHVDRDTTTWVDRRTGASHAAATASVVGITFFRGRASALKGGAIGAVSGTVVGLLVGALDGDGWFTFTPLQGAALGAVNWAAIGLVAGAGQQDRYENRHREDAASAALMPCGVPFRRCDAPVTPLPGRSARATFSLADPTPQPLP